MHTLSEGDAPTAGEGALLEHTVTCAACARALDSSRRLLRTLALASRTEIAPPSDLVPRILEALPRGKPALHRRTVWVLGGGAAIALFAGAAAGAAWLAAPGTGGAQFIWLRATRLWVSAFVARFAALLAAAEFTPALPGGPRLQGSFLVDLQGLALIAVGILGAASALYLAASTARQTPRPRSR